MSIPSFTQYLLEGYYVHSSELHSVEGAVLNLTMNGVTDKILHSDLSEI